MRIAVFGGSFDPVHKEHKRFAQEAIRSLALDLLIVMPAHTPPHKPYKQLAPDLDRLEMCRLAFSDIPKVEVSDYEIAKGGTSYTYETCRHFRSLYPDAEIFWLVGTDMLRGFPTWKNPDDILNNVTLAVCGRNDGDGWWEEEQQKFFARFSKNFARVDYNGEDVSSTKIRVLAGAGMRLTHLTAESVASYIEEKALYAIPKAKEALALEKPSRQAHSLRVAELAAARAVGLKIPERQAVEAALFHDCAKNLGSDSAYLQGFVAPTEWGEVPDSVYHQFAGAYVAKHTFGVQDEDVLNAVRYHTSGRPKMSELEKLIFLADMLEVERNYDCVDELRALFWDKDGLDKCLTEALRQTLIFLERKGADVYALTKEAYQFYENERKEKI